MCVLNRPGAIALYTAILVLTQAFLYGQRSPDISRPNVIYINADDPGNGDVGVYGATRVRTPNIDQLASEGRRFTNAHTVSAVCTPSRYAFITGEYPIRNDSLYGAIISRDSLIVDPGKLTVADVMQQAGYATACIGKWHLGFGDTRPVDWNAPFKPGPLELGFDYYLGVRSPC